MKWLFALIILAGVGLFISTDKLPLGTNSINKEGRVLSAQGIVMGLAASSEHYQDLRAGAPITNSYKIITGLNSSSLIEYGEIFKVLEQSSIQLLQIGNKYQVHLLEGTILRQQLSEKTDYFIEGVQQSSLEIKTQSQAPKEGLQPGEVTSSIPSGQSETNPRLKEILNNTFKLHQRFIERCFIKHYDKLEGKTQGGLLILDFEVGKSGRLSSIRLKQSPYKDESFHQCLLEVFSRVKLKGMDFKKIIKIEFPLQITLPNES